MEKKQLKKTLYNRPGNVAYYFYLATVRDFIGSINAEVLPKFEKHVKELWKNNTPTQKRQLRKLAHDILLTDGRKKFATECQSNKLKFIKLSGWKRFFTPRFLER